MEHGTTSFVAQRGPTWSCSKHEQEVAIDNAAQRERIEENCLLPLPPKPEVSGQNHLRAYSSIRSECLPASSMATTLHEMLTAIVARLRCNCCSRRQFLQTSALLYIHFAQTTPSCIRIGLVQDMYAGSRFNKDLVAV